MNPRPDLDAELAHTSDDLVHASDRSCRSVEGGVEAVPCGVVLDAVPARERIANHRMMREHQLLPTSVTDLGLLLRGADESVNATVAKTVSSGGAGRSWPMKRRISPSQACCSSRGVLFTEPSRPDPWCALQPVGYGRLRSVTPGEAVRVGEQYCCPDRDRGRAGRRRGRADPSLGPSRRSPAPRTRGPGVRSVGSGAGTVGRGETSRSQHQPRGPAGAPRRRTDREPERRRPPASIARPQHRPPVASRAHPHDGGLGDDPCSWSPS